MKLTIAIPTYNRSKRLEKALLDLCSAINESSSKADIAVYVSNNGSKDDTDQVIVRCGELFIENGIPFYSRTAERNQGFDANVLACYAGCNSEYVWFLSDDDNIFAGAIDAIIVDIEQHHPTIIYYNFDQKPYDKTHHYIGSTEYFDEITDVNIIALQKIVRWPKLTSMVIKKCLAGLRVPNQDSGFAHLTLALQCGLAEGGVLHSSVFTAYPDDNFMDNIDYVPHIANNIDTALLWALRENDKMYLYEQLALPYADPLATSLNALGAYYRGLHVLTLPLKNELWEIVQREIKTVRLKRLRDWLLLKELVKFPISICYYIGYLIIRGNRPTKDRRVPSDK